MVASLAQLATPAQAKVYAEPFAAVT